MEKSNLKMQADIPNILEQSLYWRSALFVRTKLMLQCTTQILEVDKCTTMVEIKYLKKWMFTFASLKGEKSN